MKKLICFITTDQSQVNPPHYAYQTPLSPPLSQTFKQEQGNWNPIPTPQNSVSPGPVPYHNHQYHHSGNMNSKSHPLNVPDTVVIQPGSMTQTQVYQQQQQHQQQQQQQLQQIQTSSSPYSTSPQQQRGSYPSSPAQPGGQYMPLKNETLEALSQSPKLHQGNPPQQHSSS